MKGRFLVAAAALVLVAPVLAAPPRVTGRAWLVENGATGEVDHLISLELGGSNARANLFPESASPRPGSHEKDRLENKLSELVCRGRVSLVFAQRLIARDWIAAGQWVHEHFPGFSWRVS